MNSDQPAITGLADIIQIQEGCIAWNTTVAVKEWAFVDAALGLGYAFTDFLHSPEVLAKRAALTGTQFDRGAIIANLLHSAWCSLGSAARLAAWGAHADSIALIRSGYESVALAEYFRRKPGETSRWDQIGQVGDMEERQKRLFAFQGISRKLDLLIAKDADSEPVEAAPPGTANSRQAFYRELSMFGPHSNPASLVMRMSTKEEGVRNLGFTSAGKPQAVEYTVTRCANVLMHCLSEFEESFRHALASRPDLLGRLATLEEDYEPISKSMPRPYFSQEFLR